MRTHFSSFLTYFNWAIDHSFIRGLIVRFFFLFSLLVNPSEGEIFSEEQNELVESAADMLYGLIHSRYILTSRGLSVMVSSFNLSICLCENMQNQCSLE
jgi:Casein kinase II regulatory subunit